MADVSREQLNNVVARVLAEVGGEVQINEARFGVGDLRASLTDLAKVGGESAWTISYSTSSLSVDQARHIAQLGGESAWKISYSTSSSPITERVAGKVSAR
jgi:hypothetical protein